MIRLFFCGLIVFVGFLAQANESPWAELRQIKMPYIKGDTLYIEGRIDSHIYDYLSFPSEALKNIKTVSLHSLGGVSLWGMEVGKKIRSLGWDTQLQKGHFCASACLYIFSAGVQRKAQTGTWLGLHGARFKNLDPQFISQCFFKTKDQESRFLDTDLQCVETLGELYTQVRRSTDQSFSLMEAWGVSKKLRLDYYAMEDESDWHQGNNILKKPDWMIPAEQALQYSLVTEVY